MSKSLSYSPVANGVIRSVSTSLFTALIILQGPLLGAQPAPSAAAASVVAYDPGSGAAARFTNPHAAVGFPSQVNPFGEPTDPFNPPFGTNQIVSIGAGGHLILGFDTPVLNHPNNVFGRDFTIFGNTGFIITNEFDLVTFGWVGEPATDGSLFGQATGEVLVSVSMHGSEFFVLNPMLAPSVDGFPPTDGAGDFGLPVIPDLAIEEFAGATLEEIQRLYDGSAGGASFDLNWALDSSGRGVFLPSVRFVRIDVISGRVEIDAVMKVNRLAGGRP